MSNAAGSPQDESVRPADKMRALPRKARRTRRFSRRRPTSKLRILTAFLGSLRLRASNETRNSTTLKYPPSYDSGAAGDQRRKRKRAADPGARLGDRNDFPVGQNQSANSI